MEMTSPPTASARGPARARGGASAAAWPRLNESGVVTPETQRPPLAAMPHCHLRSPRQGFRMQHRAGRGEMAAPASSRPRRARRPGGSGAARARGAAAAARRSCCLGGRVVSQGMQNMSRSGFIGRVAAAIIRSSCHHLLCGSCSPRDAVGGGWESARLSSTVIHMGSL
jgi:hypothetical protein